MARNITEEDKIRINELYLKIGTYSGVAKSFGCAPSTVKKYIIPNYVSKNQRQYKKIFNKEDLPDFSTEQLVGEKNWGALCQLSIKEKEEIKELWEDLLV